MPNPHVFEVVKGKDLIPVHRVRRPYNKGKNLDILLKMEPGDSIWEVPYRKVRSLRFSALRRGMKIKARRIPTSERYAVFRVS